MADDRRDAAGGFRAWHGFGALGAARAADVRPVIACLSDAAVAQVLVIEYDAAEPAWSAADLERERRVEKTAGVVATYGTVVVGFALYRTGRRSLRVLRLGVRPSFRRRGLGRLLLGHVTARLAPRGLPAAVADVRETNLGVCKFLAGCGWKAGGLRVGHFPDTGEDAVMFRFDTGEDHCGS